MSWAEQVDRAEFALNILYKMRNRMDMEICFLESIRASGRASQATPEAPAGLRHSATIADARGPNMSEFIPFPKMARLSREIIVSEKIDGTNAQIFIGEEGEFLVGSRSRWLTLEQDNFGFAEWALEHRDELLQLGPGRHFGEWWGQGIQRKYGLPEKRFSLFNAARWGEERPACCHVVPVLYRGEFSQAAIDEALLRLRSEGSAAAPGFMKPEGVIVFHVAANMGFKKTLERDHEPKSMAA